MGNRKTSIPYDLIDTIKDQVLAIDVDQVVFRLGVKSRDSYGKKEILCPLHGDKHFGSCKRHRSKNAYYCFPCNTYVNNIKLVQGILGMRRLEAIEYLAQEFCIYIPEEKDEDPPFDESIYTFLELDVEDYPPSYFKYLYNIDKKAYFSIIKSRCKVLMREVFIQKVITMSCEELDDDENFREEELILLEARHGVLQNYLKQTLYYEQKKAV